MQRAILYPRNLTNEIPKRIAHQEVKCHSERAMCVDRHKHRELYREKER